MPEFGYAPEIEEVMEIELINIHRSFLSINLFLLIYFTEFLFESIILATNLNRVMRWIFPKFCI